MNKKIIGAVSTVLSVVMIVASVYGLVSSLTIHESGTISMVKAFSDSACTQPVTDIDWGALLPDSTQNRTIYLKNFGANPVTISLTVINWSPANAPNYMQVSWDREGESIPSGIPLQTTLELSVFANITSSTISSFNFDRVINEAW